MWRGERCTSACGAPASSSARGCLHGRIPTFLNDGSHSMPRPPKPPQVASAVSSNESNGYDKGARWGLVRVAQMPSPRKSAIRSGRSSSASVASGVRCSRQLPLFRGTWCRSAVAQVVKAVSVPGDASDRALESKALRKLRKLRKAEPCRGLHQRSQSPTAAEHRCQAGCAELWDHLTSSPHPIWQFQDSEEAEEPHQCTGTRPGQPLPLRLPQQPLLLKNAMHGASSTSS